VAASDCCNTANPQTVPVIRTGAPARRPQGPCTFRGVSAYFPPMAPAAP
jgi:hypothetical protein